MVGAHSRLCSLRHVYEDVFVVIVIIVLKKIRGDNKQGEGDAQSLMLTSGWWKHRCTVGPAGEGVRRRLTRWAQMVSGSYRFRGLLSVF